MSIATGLKSDFFLYNHTLDRHIKLIMIQYGNPMLLKQVIQSGSSIDDKKIKHDVLTKFG